MAKRNPWPQHSLLFEGHACFQQVGRMTSKTLPSNKKNLKALIFNSSLGIYVDIN